MRFFALHDSDNELKKLGAFEIKEDEIEKYNNLGYGCFWVLNDFNGKRRQENVTKINYWFCDIDEGSKEEQMKRINAVALKPTFVVETKKGFHCYWQVEGEASVENYKTILAGIIHRLKADKACKDSSRLLRYPYAYHMKDPKNPYLVQIVEQCSNTYTESEMLFYFSLPKKRKETKNYNTDESIESLKIYARRIHKGERNNYLYWVKCRLKEKNLEIENNLRAVNEEMAEPIEGSELENLIKGGK